MDRLHRLQLVLAARQVLLEFVDVDHLRDHRHWFLQSFFFISFDSFGHGAYLAVEEVETLLQVGDDDLAVAHLLFGLLLLLAVTVRLLLQLHPLLPDSPQKVIDFPPTKKEYEPPS